MAATLTPKLRSESLIEALPFIQRFRGQTFVVKYGGSTMESEDQIHRFLKDLVFLEAVGINPVLVHGGGKAITAAMRKAGLKASFVNGMRLTDQYSMAIVEQVLDSEINPQLVTTLNRFGGKAVGLSGKDVFLARRLPPQPEVRGGTVDLGLVGEVTHVECTDIRAAIASEIVPVISPMGSSPEGEVLNINADIAASALASQLNASKLIFVSDVPGIMRDANHPDSLIPSVSTTQIEPLIKEKVISGGMIPKVRSAMKALQSGVSKVHLICGGVEHCLLVEIFSNAGIGTEITT